MSDYVLRPLTTAARAKLGKVTPMRSNFSAPWGQTVDLLDREVNILQGPRHCWEKYIVMVDADESRVRQDGDLRADARRLTPAAGVSFTSTKSGPMLFVCNQFTKFEDNVRGIALGLEALRKVERYGIASGHEQYRGFGELGTGMAMGISSAPAMSDHEAAQFLATWGTGVWTVILVDKDAASEAFRAAAIRLHPDTSESPELFRKLTEARRVLEF